MNLKENWNYFGMQMVCTFFSTQIFPKFGILEGEKISILVAKAKKSTCLHTYTKSKDYSSEQSKKKYYISSLPLFCPTFLRADKLGYYT